MSKNALVGILAYQSMKGQGDLDHWHIHTELWQDTGTLKAAFNFVKGLIVLDKQNSNLNNM